ncbi:GNAT family N-acetyltransferase [Granulosicoccus sp. 3-233]|uniref:GNAT family N-acetyltransferase n=1 Tax=Granulosicoccus sp. 3-233 TaxID=3417969 RepID=UPI003D33221F
MKQQLQLEVRDSLEAVPAAHWNALCDDGNPFLRHEFLHTLDQTGCLGESTGWYPRYFLLWDGDEDSRELIGGVPAYVKTNSYGEFVFDWAWAEAYERHQMEYYPKLVSSIPFTPATGQRLLVRADQPYEQTVSLMARAVRQFADSQGYSSVHYLFLTERESAILSAVEPVATDQQAESASEDGTAPATSGDDAAQTAGESEQPPQANDHLKRIDCQYHWQNDNYSDFDDFLALCTSRRRKTLRRERRHVSDAGLRLEQRLGSSLSQTEWRWVHRFYESTFDRKWGNPSLTLAFFETIGKKMGDQVLIVFAFDDEDEQPEWPVACSVMFIGDSTLYGRYWGCRRDYHSLHFEACYYQGIEYCIANGIARFEPGAQGEHKITRGFLPTITRSAHYVAHPGFRDAIADFLSQERPYIEQRCSGLADLLPFKAETLSL